MLRELGWLVLFIENTVLHQDRSFPYWPRLCLKTSPDKETFGVLLWLHLHPLGARGSFSALLLRKLGKRLSGGRESTEPGACSLCKASQHQTQVSAFSWAQHHWPKGRNGAMLGDLQVRPVSCAVLSALLTPWQETQTLQNQTLCFRASAGLLLPAGLPLEHQWRAGGDALAQGMTSITPEALCTEEKTPLLCTELLDTWWA